MRNLCTTLFLGVIILYDASSIFAQTVTIEETFSDGDFTDHPVWTDLEGKYTINADTMLQLAAPSNSGEAFISTTSSAVYGEWQASIHLDFNPSSRNLCRFYIIANQGHSVSDLYGYYVQVGDTDDEVSLYRQDGNKHIRIIDGQDDLVNSSSVNVRVRIRRNIHGNWELGADTTAGLNFISQGTTNDNTYTSGNFIGFLSDYTSTRSNRFAYDDIKVTKVNPPLRIRSVRTLNNRTIDVALNFNVAPTSVLSSNFSLNNQVGHPEAVTLISPDSLSLSYAAPLPGNFYDLTISGISDTEGNTLTSDTTISFTLFDTYEWGDIIINEFMYNPPSSLPEFIELKNVSDKLLNLSDWAIGDQSNEAVIADDTLILLPHEYITITPDTSTLHSTFTLISAHQLPSIPSFNNNGDVIKLVTNDGIIADSLSYDASWGGNGVSLERRSQITAAIYKENFGDSPHELGGTPGRKNEVPPDLYPPEPVKIVIQDSVTADISFSERLDANSASETTNYALDQNIYPANVISISPNRVRLSFLSPLKNAITYSLQLSGQKDIFENTLQNYDTTLVYYKITPADSGEIFINEFSYDPASDASEFVELYNPTDKSFDLNGWSISDATGSPRIISNYPFILPPKNYLVLTEDQQLGELYPDINLIDLGNSFPSLNNGGDLIIIRDSTGQLLDSLKYDPEWGGSGASLERRSVNVPAVKGNFGESPDSMGTPGLANAISPDVNPPFIQSISILTSKLLSITFSEQVTHSSASDLDNYFFSEESELKTAISLTDTTVELTLANQMLNNSQYQLRVENIEDIFGNKLYATDTTFTYYQISPPDSGDVCINEFMYNPPEDISEYIEIYNASEKTFNLDNWSIIDGSGNRAKISETSFLLPPQHYLIIARDSSFIDTYPSPKSFISLSRFPSLNNKGDAIVLEDSTGQKLDSLFYGSDWGGNGVALERRTTNVGPLQPNFGESPNGFGTPGQENEILQDVKPPVLTEIAIQDSSHFQLVYSEYIHKPTAEDKNNYKFENGLTIVSVQPTSANSLAITVEPTLKNATAYTLTIASQNDLFGNIASLVDTTLIYYEISPVDSGSVFLNEFMYDPPDAYTEYIELYNPGPYSYDIDGWSINDNTGNKKIITSRSSIFPPNSFIVLAPDESLLQSSPDINIIALGNSFPSLNNGGDAIVLTDSTGLKLDSLSYFKNWGGEEVALERRTHIVPPMKPNFGDAPEGYGTPGTTNIIAPDTTPPVISKFSVIAPQLLQVGFSEPVLPHLISNDSIAISGDTGIASFFFKQPDTLSIYLSNKLQNNKHYEVSFSGIRDIFGNTASSARKVFTYHEYTAADSGDIFINEFNFQSGANRTEYIELYNPSTQTFNISGWTLNDNTSIRRIITANEKPFPPTTHILLAPDSSLIKTLTGVDIVVMGNRFPSLNDYSDIIVIRDENGKILDSLAYTAEWSTVNKPLERRSVDVPSIKPNFGNVTDSSGTPGSVNSIGPDTDPPALTGLYISNSQTLQLFFSEYLDNSAFGTTDYYQLSGQISIDEVDKIDDQRVRISLTRKLKNGTKYELSIKNVKDWFGNSISQTDTCFTYYETSLPDSSSIFINEFLYHPPEGSVEYVEIYNPTDKSYDINGWTLSDNTGQKRPISTQPIILAPDSFVVITSDQTLLSDFPDILLAPMGSLFPTLNNAGDAIILRDSTGLLLDSLNYTADWGGQQVPLERRSINITSLKPNFGEAPGKKGTPGRPNRIAPDQTPPSVLHFSVSNNNKIEVVFSEIIKPETVSELSHFHLSGGPAIKNSTSNLSDTVFINLENELENNTTYTLSINGIEDYFSNVITKWDTTFTYYKPSMAQTGDIFINEFLYNPPEGYPEFVELYNPTLRSFDINGWTLQDNTGNSRLITEETVIFPPKSFLLLTPEDTYARKNSDIQSVSMKSRFPSLNNNGDDIVIRNRNGTLLDSLRYNTDWGGNNSALERRTVKAPALYPNFTEPKKIIGSPGLANSVPIDSTSPSFQALEITGSTTLQLVFSEMISVESAAVKSNYKITPMVEIQLISVSDKTITLYLHGQLESNKTYRVEVSGLKDIFGNTSLNEYLEATYISFSTAKPGDVIINEFLYQSNDENSAEFIELYNPTKENFDLSGWRLSDSRSSSLLPDNIFLLADRYLVITGDATFAKGIPESIYLPSLPTLNNDEDILHLEAQNGVSIDSLSYNLQFGGNKIGKSAERIDPGAASNDHTNFATSISVIGSTPGVKNSVFQLDTTPPSITYAKLQMDNRVEIRFSEFISITPSLQLFINNEQTEINNFMPQNGNIVYIQPHNLNKQKESFLKVENVSDIRGNINSSAQMPISHSVTHGDIVINEILFDPIGNMEEKGTGQGEYIELRNIRDFTISLENMHIHNAPNASGTIDFLRPLNSHSKSIPPQGNAIIYAEESSAFSKSRIARFFDLDTTKTKEYLHVQRSSLSLSAAGDAVYLASSDSTVIDSVHFSDKWHNPNLIDTKGIALERIDPAGHSNDPKNWGSSTHVRGGTPGRENSIFQQAGAAPADYGISFTPNPFSPDGDGSDDHLFINYRLDAPDYLLTVDIYDRYGRHVRKLADGEPAGFEGALVWDGLRGNGRPNRIGIYIVVFRAYNAAAGRSKSWKKTVVLARRLR